MDVTNDSYCKCWHWQYQDTLVQIFQIITTKFAQSELKKFFSLSMLYLTWIFVLYNSNRRKRIKLETTNCCQTTLVKWVILLAKNNNTKVMIIMLIWLCTRELISGESALAEVHVVLPMMTYNILIKTRETANVCIC